MLRRSGFILVLLLLGPLSGSRLGAFVNESQVGQLKPAAFCVNASFQTSWRTAQAVLRELEIPMTLGDPGHRVMASAFVAAETSKLRRIARNARFMYNGRFAVKLAFEEQTPSYTKLLITVQIRQGRWLGRDERLLKSRGTFEKLLAFRINQLAIATQFREIYEFRIGFDLIPEIVTERYRIGDVEENSPAGEAGFRKGDLVTAFDGKEVSIRGELFQYLLDVRNEKQAHVTVKRKDGEVTLPVWLIRVPEGAGEVGAKIAWDGEQHQFRVTEVEAGSRAGKAGFRPGDVLVKGGDLRLDSWSNYYRALARARPNVPEKVEVQRGGEALQIVIN
ncbi:MAG: PDZ domain-containing protein [Candidatus Omnitrophota bacterium]